MYSFDIFSISTPFIYTFPELGFIKPINILTRVDFPYNVK